MGKGERIFELCHYSPGLQSIAFTLKMSYRYNGEEVGAGSSSLAATRPTSSPSPSHSRRATGTMGKGGGILKPGCHSPSRLSIAFTLKMSYRYTGEEGGGGGILEPGRHSLSRLSIAFTLKMSYRYNGEEGRRVEGSSSLAITRPASSPSPSRSRRATGTMAKKSSS
jgi:hypothetical protein